MFPKQCKHNEKRKLGNLYLKEAMGGDNTVSTSRRFHKPIVGISYITARRDVAGL